MAAAYRERMGERIRQRREELGLSRADLARELPGKTNENAIYRWEKGEHEPRPDTVEALAVALKVDVASLLAPASEKENGTPDLFAGQPPGLDVRLAAIERQLDCNRELLEMVLAKLGVKTAEEAAGLRHSGFSDGLRALLRPQADTPQPARGETA